jgi:hypothetical protein
MSDTNIAVGPSTDEISDTIYVNYGALQQALFDSFVQYLCSLSPNFNNCVVGDPTGKYTWTIYGPGPIQYQAPPPNPSPYAPQPIPHSTTLNPTMITSMMSSNNWIPDFNNLLISMYDGKTYKFTQGGVPSQ